METPLRANIITGLGHQAPTLKALQKVTHRRKRVDRRACLRLQHIAFLDKAWGGRLNWAHHVHAPFDTLGVNVISDLNTITQVAIRNNIALPTLWAEDGILEKHARSTKSQMLTVATCRAAKLEFLAQLPRSTNTSTKEIDDADGFDNLDLPIEEYSDASDDPEAKRQKSMEDNSFSSEPENAREAPGPCDRDLADITLADTEFIPAFGVGDESKCGVDSFLLLLSLIIPT